MVDTLARYYNTVAMDAVKFHLRSDGCVGHILRKLATVVSQLIIVLLVWEFLRSSRETTESGDENFSQLNLKTKHIIECFQKSSHGDSLDFDSIISHNKAVHFSNDKTIKHFFLSVDILVRTPGTDSVLVYKAGTQVNVRDETANGNNQLWDIDYFEYNDDVSQNNLFNKDSQDRNLTSISRPEAAALNGQVLERNQQNQTETSRAKIVYASNSNLETGRQQGAPQEAPQVERGVIDIMLVQDQMLNVRPRDQARQQQILHLLKRRKEFRERKFQQLSQGNLEQAQLNSHRTTAQNELNGMQQQTVTTGSTLHSDINRNSSKGLTLAWPDVVMDETSEPLYTDGFLERVQRVKAELYGRKVFYNKKFKTKVKKIYLLNNPSLCQRSTTVQVVYLINSQAENTEQRQLLRQTVLKTDTSKSFPFVHVFLVGRSSSPDLQSKLKSESELYRDIVQGDFDDTAQNGAWKVLMGMRWVLQFCGKVRFILKTNKNVFLDTDKLVRGLIPVSASVIGKRALFCAWNSVGSSGGNNNRTLPFCDGFAVLMTRHLVCSIVASSNQIRVPVIEDYYLYGVLPFVTGGVEVYNLTGNHGFQKNAVDSLSCYRDRKHECPTLATQTVNGDFTSLLEMTQKREDDSYEWPMLWDLKSVKSYLS